MYTVSFTKAYTNAINFQYPNINLASTLGEAINYISFIKPNESFEHYVFEITSDDCEIEFAVILSDVFIYVIFTGMGKRVYDYSHADEAIEFIKIMGSLMGEYSFEEEEY